MMNERQIKKMVGKMSQLFSMTSAIMPRRFNMKMKLQKQKTKLLASLILAILFSITCSSPTTATGGDDGNGGDNGGNPNPPNKPNPCLADPPPETCVVNTADWLASFMGNDALPTMPDATPTNEFLEISATTASSRTNVIPTTLFMTGSTDNGLAFFTENGAYYAGVLAGTNLGAPITAPFANVRWTGQILTVSNNGSSTIDGSSKNTLGLDITFDGTNGGKMTSIFYDVQFLYSIDGDFDANGIITGSIDFGFGDANGISTTEFRRFYSPGTLSGIIGQNGTVGVFHSDNDNTEAGSQPHSFAGGFVVVPPSDE